MLKIMNQKEFDNIFDDLTQRQKQVLCLALQGKSDQAIAESLGVKTTTVRKHLEKAAEIFGLQSPERRSRRNEIFSLIIKYKPELLEQENEKIYQTENNIIHTINNSKQTKDSELLSENIFEEENLTQETKSESLLKLLALAKNKKNQKKIALELNEAGYKHYLQGQLKDAKDHFKLAIEYDSELIEAHYNLGLTYEKLGEDNDAFKHYQIAAKYDIDISYIAINNLARLSIIKGDFQQAIKFIEAIINKVEKKSIKASLYKNLAWAIYCEGGDLDLVKTYLDESIKLNNNYLPALYLLILVLLEIADTEKDNNLIIKASEIWEKCHDLEKSTQKLPETNKFVELDYWNHQIYRKFRRHELCAV